MAKPFDYSKWDNIELSDDESDLHPNIDKDSWFRMKHRSRLEREEQEDQEKAEINEKNEEAQRRIRELRARIERVHKASADEDDVVDDEEALVAEMNQLEGEVSKRMKRVAEIDKKRSWTIDNICHVKEEKTVINKATPSSSLSAHDYTPQGHWRPDDEEPTEASEPKSETSASTVAAPTSAAATTPAPTTTAHAAAAPKAVSSASSAPSKAAAKKPVTDRDEVISYNDFVIGNEQVLESFCELQDLELSRDFLYKHGHILLHEHGQAYILLSCLEDQMNGKYERARQVCRQSQLLTHVTELATSMKRDPRDVVLAFFRRIEEPQYREVFETSLQEFVERIKKRAVEKRLEMAKEEMPPLAPGQLDPQEVFASLPESIQQAFESRDVASLNRALAGMDRKEGRRHMRRCVASGLWVPQNPHEFDSDPEDEGQATGEDQDHEEIDSEEKQEVQATDSS